MSSITRCAAIAAVVLLAIAPAAWAGSYTVSFLDGGSWNTVYVQGFNTSLGATPNPGVANGSPVSLSKFEFFKSGSVDSAANIRLAIIDNIFPSSPTVNHMTTTSPIVVGLSTNTIADTTGIAPGDPIAFDFADLPLTYGTDYAAVLVNVGTDSGNGAPLTPVRVSALTANYTEVTPGDWHPTSNYGTESEYNYATSDFITLTGYFNTYSYAGDANFRATLNAVPEPAAAVAMVIGAAIVAAGRRWGVR